MQSKLPVLLVFSLLILGSVFAYESQGSTTGTPQPPENQDTYYFDLDAAFTFSGGEPGNAGPSAFYGEEAVLVEGGSVADRYPDESSGTESIVKKYVSGGEGTGNWGDGELQQTTVSVNDGVVRTNYQGIPYLVQPPHPDASQAENRCGDSVHSDGNNELSCPEDYGLPSDEYDSSTKADSSEMMSVTFIQQVGEYDVNDIGSVSGVGDSSDDTDDYIDYDPGVSSSTEFLAREHNTDETEDITGKFVGPGTVTYEDMPWEYTPDFYLKDGGTEIWMKYIKVSGSTSIDDGQNPVTTLDLTTGTFDDYEDSPSSYSDTSCSASSGWECDGSSNNVDCKGISQNTVESHYLLQETITLNADNPTEYKTSTGSGNGISEQTNSDPSFTVDVTYNHDYETEEVDADNCVSGENGEITTYTCNNVSWGGSCSTWGSTDYYPEDTGNPDGEGSGVYYDDVEEHEWDYRYQTLTYDDAKIFDVNPAENPSGTPMPSDEALFWNDQFKTNSGASTVTYGSGTDSELSVLSTSGTGYYSWGISPQPEMLGNDPAVSVSTFSIDVEGGRWFYSVRDSFDTFDADGPYGESDGYVAIRHTVDNKGTASESKDTNDYQIVGTTPLFMDQETTTDGASTNFYNADPGSQPGWLPACPGNQIKCVAAADISLDNLGTWSDGTPNAGDVTVDTTTAYAIDRSLSVCKMYEKLAGSDSYDLNDIRKTNCQYETPPPDGGGGDPPSTCDQDPSECDTGPGTRWHTMEGPEVNEERFQNADTNAVLDDYESRVEHSECVLDGTNVPEGRVANVASDANAGYETGGDSPDWEVCLNIHDVPSEYQDISNGYHSEGAHEFGGQWYDLDDDRVDYYLRPSNDNGGNGGEDDYDGKGHRLISDATSSQRNDPNHISYYYRKNPNPYHPVWNPRGFTLSGGNREYYYGLNFEQDCDQDLDGCDDTGINENFAFSFLWQNQGETVDDYNYVRSPPV